jgi:hypothetical protein
MATREKEKFMGLSFSIRYGDNVFHIDNDNAAAFVGESLTVDGDHFADEIRQRGANRKLRNIQKRHPIAPFVGNVIVVVGSPKSRLPKGIIVPQYAAIGVGSNLRLWNILVSGFISMKNISTSRKKK